MNKLETPLIRWYWDQVGGTLVEEYVIVKAGEGHGQRSVDAIIVLGEEKVRMPAGAKYELAGKNIIVIQAERSPLEMSLCGRVLFSREVIKKELSPRTIRSVALCTKTDLLLQGLLESYDGCEVVVCPDDAIHPRQDQKSTFNAYEAHRFWWTVLPAIPPSQSARDWWAANDDRATRYQRLKRVWYDRTYFCRPKQDPERAHWFSSPAYGTCATISIWENFVLFHPREMVPLLMARSGIECSAPISDACWSYEYRDPSTGRIPDVVLHARGDSGQEICLVIEAKYSKSDKLKEKPSMGLPDADPDAHRNLECFLDIDRRETIYLVREDYVATVRSKVGGYNKPYGLLTWQDLIRIQIRLCGGLPRGAGMAVESVICCVARRLGVLPAEYKDIGDTSPEELRKLLDSHPNWPDYLKDWFRAAADHLYAMSGELPVDPAFPYLKGEPSFADLHLMKVEGHQKEFRALEGAQLWRVPATH